MKIVFIPWNEENPYQQQLADALAGIGHTIHHCEHKRIFTILRYIMKNGRPDIIHFHWLDPFIITKRSLTTIIISVIFLLEIILMKILGIKTVWTVHNLISHERIHPKIEKLFRQILLNMFDEIIHLSQASVSRMNGFYCISQRTRAKFHVVPHGHYIYWYKNSINRETARSILEIDKDSPVLLCFGAIRPYKGIDLLVDAIQDIPESNLRVLIAGRPKNRDIENQLRGFCTRDKRIETFSQFIPDYDVQIFMNAADILVLPYSDVLNSGATILAMSFAKSVIAPNIGSIPELIDGQGGVLFEPNNRKSLVRAINQSLSQDLQAMGRYNLQKIGRLDWNSIAQMTADIYAS